MHSDAEGRKQLGDPCASTRHTAAGWPARRAHLRGARPRLAAAQVKLAKALRAREVLARRSQHYIMFSQPGVIIRAIRGVVRAVRRERRHEAA
jgi:hypothetical protein